jgi:hypothetical protein
MGISDETFAAVRADFLRGLCGSSERTLRFQLLTNPARSRLNQNFS